MDPVFTLQWPEFVLANRLTALLPRKEDYSIFVPASRQEKGVDLAVVRKVRGSSSRVATIQIKASRTYTFAPPRRETTKRYQFETWFDRFDVPPEADFFLLFGMYAPNAGQTKKVGPLWYKDCTLLFTQDEMKHFIERCLTVAGNPDRMFGFGFDSDAKVVQTRGDKDRRFKDYTSYLLDKKVGVLKRYLERT